MNHVHANLITLIFQHHQQTEKTLSCLLLGCCLLSPSVAECHFVCGKNRHGFHRTPRGVCWVTSWENFSYCSLSYVENGGNYVENYPLRRSVSIEGKKKERTKTKQFYKNGSQLRELEKLSTGWF